jgi:hypothetical protein
MTEEETSAPEAEGEAPKKKIGEKYRKLYGKEGHNGDALGAALKEYVKSKDGVDEDKLNEVAKQNGLDLAKYADRNIGMKRMILGNLLRSLNAGGKKRDGVVVWIGDTQIPAGSVKGATPPPRPAKDADAA